MHMQRRHKVDLRPLLTYADRDVEDEDDQHALDHAWQEPAALAASASPRAQLVTKILPHYLEVYERGLGRRACPLHDPLAAGIVLDRSLVTKALTAPVAVERGFGRARAERREHALHVVAGGGAHEVAAVLGDRRRDRRGRAAAGRAVSRVFSVSQP